MWSLFLNVPFKNYVRSCLYTTCRMTFFTIPDFTANNNNLISRHALSPIPRCSHAYLSGVPWEIRQRRSDRWPSGSYVCTAAPVDMSHDRYGSYWKLTAVWGAVVKYKFVILNLLCCENACEGKSVLTSSWLTLFLRSVM